MIRSVILGLSLSLISLTSFAVETNNGQAMIGVGDVLRGRFVEERHLQGFNGPMTSQGHFTVAPQYGLIWGIEKPFQTTTVITPAGLAQNINGLTIMHLPAQKIPFLLHLYDMLGGALEGNWKPLEADFHVARHVDGDKWQVLLTPRRTDNPAMPFNSITISGHRFVENVVMMKPDGDSDTLSFLNEVVTTQPPGAEEKLAYGTVRP